MDLPSNLLFKIVYKIWVRNIITLTKKSCIYGTCMDHVCHVWNMYGSRMSCIGYVWSCVWVVNGMYGICMNIFEFEKEKCMDHVWCVCSQSFLTIYVWAVYGTFYL